LLDSLLQETAKMPVGPPCYNWLLNRCPFSDLACRFPHNKDGMPLCQNWVRSACIGGHGNSCKNRHYYTQWDAATKPNQSADPPSRSNGVLTEFSSPLVTRVEKIQEHHKRVEIDLETGKRRSFIETTEQEIIDITGKENTPVKAPVAKLANKTPGPKVDLLKRVLAPSNSQANLPSMQNSEPGLCVQCKKIFKGERGLKSHLRSKTVACGKSPDTDTSKQAYQQEDSSAADNSIIVID